MSNANDLWIVIRDARDARGWTNEKLSMESGVPESSIQKYLTGKTAEPRFENVVRLCRALGISVDAHCGIDSNASVTEIAELRSALQLAEARKEAAQAKMEAVETRLQSQINEYNQMVSAYEYRIDIAKDRTIWIRRALIAVSAVCVSLMAAIVGILVYDITHLDRGWFQAAAAYYYTGISWIKDFIL